MSVTLDRIAAEYMATDLDIAVRLLAEALDVQGQTQAEKIIAAKQKVALVSGKLRRVARGGRQK